MNKSLAIAFIVVGTLLIIYGVRASDSLSSDVSRFFTGSPTDKTLWLTLSGLISGILGVTLLIRNK